MQHPDLTFEIAKIADVQRIVDITNDAFMADVFFKKSEFHLRFNVETVIDMISASNSFFLIAYTDNTDNEKLLGSLYLKYDKF